MNVRYMNYLFTSYLCYTTTWNIFRYISNTVAFIQKTSLGYFIVVNHNLLYVHAGGFPMSGVTFPPCYKNLSLIRVCWWSWTNKKKLILCQRVIQKYLLHIFYLLFYFKLVLIIYKMKTKSLQLILTISGLSNRGFVISENISSLILIFQILNLC